MQNAQNHRQRIALGSEATGKNAPLDKTAHDRNMILHLGREEVEVLIYAALRNSPELRVSAFGGAKYNWAGNQ
jgi:hypothetical protein